MNAGNITFDFADSVQPAQFEVNGRVVAGWPANHKVVDIVAHDIRACWLIEAKDYRIITNPPRRSNLGGLATTVDQKVRHTLAGLVHYSNHGSDEIMVAHARALLTKRKRRVVLHLEPYPAGGPHSKLFPKRFPALVLQKLKQLVRSIDKRPLVLDIASTQSSGVPWTAF